jgi:hypothetical protein
MKLALFNLVSTLLFLGYGLYAIGWALQAWLS